ncbi:MAG TPA: hypothetical protein VGH74_21745 [Planctomycetaceae bacterium]
MLIAAILAMGGLLIGSSSGKEDDDAPAGKPKADAVQAAKTLTITIAASENGQVASFTVGLAKLFEGPLDGRKLQILDRRLKDVFAIEGKPFEQVILRVGEKLNAGDLIKIIKVCERQKLADGSPIKKMSFAVLDAD